MPLHISIPIENTMECIDNTVISPLISHCKIKVCYVSDQPNRNNTIITKDVAREMGRKLPGSPVVAYFNKENKDFDTHNRELVVEGGKYELVDITRPYGFIPTNANVWFEKFNDEGIEREYLVTEGYIWTGAYPESQRIIDKGNNQSMELTKDSGSWVELNNIAHRVFIYNEALIEKLCVLGENVEPCFEGAQITSFSLDTNSKEFQEFKNTMYAMISELKETLNKGGSPEAMENENLNTPQNEENVTPIGNFENKSCSEEEEEKKKNNNSGNDSDNEKNDDKEKDKKKYNLDEVVEYQELLTKYNALQIQYSTLQQDKQNLDTEVNALRQFKLNADRQSKQAMIDSFYMLNDEQKKDVVDNMDTYSLDDIEAKLSILCVRNKVNFNKEPQNKPENDKPEGMFNLNSVDPNNGLPDWIKAVKSNEQN